MKIRHCTLHDHKNQTKSYDFLQIKRVHALDSSVSFKPIFVDFTLVINMLSLLHYYCHGRAINLFLFCTRFKHYEFFHNVWFDQNSPFYFSPFMTLIFSVEKKN